MSMYNQNKSGFVYIWYDRKHTRFYVGCHWGYEDDGYVCSSDWMMKAYKIRPEDFKRRMLTKNIESRPALYIEEQRWLDMIEPTEIKPTNDTPRYYNLQLKSKDAWHIHEDKRLTIGAKISAAKTGKSTGPCSPEKARAISEAKRKSTKEKRAAGLPAYTVSDKVKESWSNRGPASPESKIKCSESHKIHWSTHTHHNTGKSLSEEHRTAIGAGLIGHEVSTETRIKLSQANSKTYTITYANNYTEIVSGLKAFAKSHNIPYVTLNKAYIHKGSIHKYNIASIIT